MATLGVLNIYSTTSISQRQRWKPVFEQGLWLVCFLHLRNKSNNDGIAYNYNFKETKRLRAATTATTPTSFIGCVAPASRREI